MFRCTNIAGTGEIGNGLSLAMKLTDADPTIAVEPGDAHRRNPTFALNAMVATSQPLATQAGLDALKRGGNAADAAVAAAAMLTVLEPMWTGIGGDCFALIWKDGKVEGLDAAGPAPREVDDAGVVDERGPRSVTVPGAVAGWDALLRRHGKLGLDACLSDAIHVAESGFALSPIVAWHWKTNQAPPALTPAPRLGSHVRFPELAVSLRQIADTGPSALYRGRLAQAIARSCWITEDDLAGFTPRWVEPLVAEYRGHQVVEMPPPNQGVAALEGLALLNGMTPTLESQIDAVRLALEDARKHVRDGSDVSGLLDPSFLRRRRGDAPSFVSEPGGGTVQISVIDQNRMAVSLIQSLYMPFGSRVVAEGTGILLQNRAACFSIEGRITPGRRPYHTILPALLLRGGDLFGAFGIVGGFVQAQAHVQFVSNLVDRGLDPQAALDRPRFMLEGDTVRLERGLWGEAERLNSLGYRTSPQPNRYPFGGGQAVFVDGNVLIGGSDSRKDGIAAGF